MQHSHAQKEPSADATLDGLQSPDALPAPAVVPVTSSSASIKQAFERHLLRDGVPAFVAAVMPNGCPGLTIEKSGVRHPVLRAEHASLSVEVPRSLKDDKVPGAVLSLLAQHVVVGALTAFAAGEAVPASAKDTLALAAKAMTGKALSLDSEIRGFVAQLFPKDSAPFKERIEALSSDLARPIRDKDAKDTFALRNSVTGRLGSIAELRALRWLQGDAGQHDTFCATGEAAVASLRSAIDTFMGSAILSGDFDRANSALNLKQLVMDALNRGAFASAPPSFLLPQEDRQPLQHLSPEAKIRQLMRGPKVAAARPFAASHRKELAGELSAAIALDYLQEKAKAPPESSTRHMWDLFGSLLEAAKGLESILKPGAIDEPLPPALRGFVSSLASLSLRPEELSGACNLILKRESTMEMHSRSASGSPEIARENIKHLLSLVELDVAWAPGNQDARRALLLRHVPRLAETVTRTLQVSAAYLFSGAKQSIQGNDMRALHEDADLLQRVQDAQQSLAVLSRCMPPESFPERQQAEIREQLSEVEAAIRMPNKLVAPVSTAEKLLALRDNSAAFPPGELGQELQRLARNSRPKLLRQAESEVSEVLAEAKRADENADLELFCAIATRLASLIKLSPAESSIRQECAPQFDELLFEHIKLLGDWGAGPIQEASTLLSSQLSPSRGAEILKAQDAFAETLVLLHNLRQAIKAAGSEDTARHVNHIQILVDKMFEDNSVLATYLVRGLAERLRGKAPSEDDKSLAGVLRTFFVESLRDRRQSQPIDGSLMNAFNNAADRWQDR